MSEYSEVTTDYILKGIEPVENENKKSVENASKILYIASTALGDNFLTLLLESCQAHQ